MSIHFANRAAAVSHLTAKGFSELKSGNWASDAGFAAHILTTRNGDIVCVQVWEIAWAEAV